MRLQDVIKEREAEITVLETTLKEKSDMPPTPPSTDAQEESVHMNGNGDAALYLSPKTMSQFSEIRKSLDLHQVNLYTDSDVDESLERLNELMRFVAIA